MAPLPPNARDTVVTVILGRVTVAFTSKVPSLPRSWSFSKPSFPWQQGTFTYPARTRRHDREESGLEMASVPRRYTVVAQSLWGMDTEVYLE